jgi:hypothetical protein
MVYNIVFCEVKMRDLLWNECICEKDGICEGNEFKEHQPAIDLAASTLPVISFSVQLNTITQTTRLLSYVPRPGRWISQPRLMFQIGQKQHPICRTKAGQYSSGVSDIHTVFLTAPLVQS